ncbi:hypothetical protein [Vibrio sp. R78045]|uniref:hypothetical protein n=1 Tax=Vibrio sp. R78045 TaxID=3093868 RepID=UPI0036F2C82D
MNTTMYQVKAVTPQTKLRPVAYRHLNTDPNKAYLYALLDQDNDLIGPLKGSLPVTFDTIGSLHKVTNKPNPIRTESYHAYPIRFSYDGDFVELILAEELSKGDFENKQNWKDILKANSYF